MNWYLRHGVKPIGPYSTEAMIERLESGQVSPEDWLWRDDAAEWKAAVKWPEFAKVQMPAMQEFKTTFENEVVWILLQDGKTKGPYSMQEIRDGIKECRIQGHDSIWKKGMTGWARISSRPEALIEPLPENLFRP